ncbi:hypothetical protein NKH80_29125 [Mesorhizobium sp. M0904]|uniref:hypothetical protein n=1 Tax=Mesorhizobium sp. M0904 TaxID=2957022 RepID=UPI00333E1171
MNDKSDVKTDEKRFNETLKRMLQTPPDHKGGRASVKPETKARISERKTKRAKGLEGSE